MSSAYIIETVDLSVVHDKFQIISTAAAKVASVYVITLAAPASIHFGGGQPWDLEQGKDYEPCPPETDSIYISNPAGAGVLKLAITFEQGAIPAA